jgi:hypothetical protein
MQDVIKDISKTENLCVFYAVFACTFVCLRAHLCACVHICVPASTFVCLRAHLYVCVHICLSVCTFRGSGVICNQAKLASLQSFSNHYILPSKHSMLYSPRGLLNTKHKHVNKRAKFKHCFSVMVDMSIKTLAWTNGMKVFKVFSSLEKMSGGSDRNRWLMQIWLVCHWHPVSFKSLSFEKWQYVDTFSGSVCFVGRIQ